MNVPNFNDVPKNAPVTIDVMYEGMPMSKGIAQFLRDVEGEQKNIPEVHKSCAKVDNTEDTLVTIEVDESENIMEEDTVEEADTIDDDDNGTEGQNVEKNKRFTNLSDDLNHKIVFVPQQIDTSNIPGPVPRAEQ